jgi:hypothetical protein
MGDSSFAKHVMFPVPQTGGLKIKLLVRGNAHASKPAIFNWCVAAHWCDAKGVQVCGKSLMEDPESSRKEIKEIRKS